MIPKKITKLNLVIFIILFSINQSNLLSAPEIIFSKESGFYDLEFDLILTSTENTKIYYTTDGSDPTNSNTTQEYNQPIKIKDRTSEPNIYSNYEEDENSPISISVGEGYKKPTFNIDKAMIIRAVIKNSNNSFSKIYQKTYFITTENLSNYENLTVVSLITNPKNLFDPDTGIYVTGNQYIESIKKGEYFEPWDSKNPCNYFMKGKKWEREAYIEIFEKSVLTLQENVGIRVKGSSSRHLPQKNFNVYFRKKYGKDILESSTLFPDNKDINGNIINKYDSFSLRGISDEQRSRDQFSQSFIRDRILQATANMKNCYLFLNGEFWGLYTLTEKFSKKFFADHYILNETNIVYMKEEESKANSENETNELIDFLKIYSNKDLTNLNNYKKVCDYIDVDSLIEHYATAIFLVHYDWPNRNYGFWKSKGNLINDNLFSDGKWRLITYDLDYTMGQTYEDFGGVEGYAYDMFKKVDEAKDIPNSLFLSLLKNNEFKEKFKNIFEEYANKIMNLDKVNELINEYKNNLVDMWASSLTRWNGYSGGTRLEVFANYKNQYLSKTLPQIKKFFEERAKYALEDMEEYLK